MMTPERQRIIDALREGPGTSAEIAVDLGLNLKASSQALSRMRRNGLVRVIGMTKPENGRPARIFEVVE
jgi:predicted ArsR family transcriptional regulator